MEIKKGNRFVCVKDVVINGGDIICYKKGNFYISEQDYCITDERCLVEHFWSYPSENSIIPSFNEHFIPYSKLDRVYTHSTDTLENLWNCYKGKKNNVSLSSNYIFTNCNTAHEPGYFWAERLGDDYFLSQDYTYLSEKAFIEFMGLTDTTDTKAPQPHYDNSNGSLFQLAEQLGLNHWEFDILKRLVRCRKKGQFKEDLQKIKDTCDIYLKESPN